VQGHGNTTQAELNVVAMPGDTIAMDLTTELNTAADRIPINTLNSEQVTALAQHINPPFAHS